MDKHSAQAALSGLNLTEFAKRSRVPLRTLARIKAGGHQPTKATLLVLEMDLKRIKPRADGT